MPVRRLVDVGVAQDEDGVWRERQVISVRRFRVRVVSDLTIGERGAARAHRAGSGEEFEVVVDSAMELWFRRLGSDAPLRRDVDGGGVSLILVEDVTSGVTHELIYPTRPSDDQVCWSCSCGQRSRGWLARSDAEREAADHVQREVRKDQIREEATLRYLERRREENLRLLTQAEVANDVPEVADPGLVSGGSGSGIAT